MSLTPRVLIVEDDALTRSTMASALTASGLVVVGEAQNASTALRIFAESGADVALIDLDLGGGPTGIDLAVELRNRDANIGLIILTSYDDPRLLSAGLSSIPSGTIYLRKKQISSVHDVHSAITRAWRNPRSREHGSEIRTHDLTDGNIALLREIAIGMTNQQIADANGISVSAVEKSIRRLSKALGINDSIGNPRALLIQSYLRMSGRDVGTTS